VPLTGTQPATLYNTSLHRRQGDQLRLRRLRIGTSPRCYANVTTAVSQVRSSSFSKNAYVGQWDLTPLNTSDDKFARILPPQSQAPSIAIGKVANTTSSGVNMANTSAYPGQSDYRNKSTNDWANGKSASGCSWPRRRVTEVQQVLNSS
jgi:hypothetical protein